MRGSRFDSPVLSTYHGLILLLQRVYMLLSSDQTIGGELRFLSAKSLNTCQKSELVL